VDIEAPKYTAGVGVLGINWDFEIRYNLDLYNDYGSKIRVKDCNVLSYSDRRK